MAASLVVYASCGESMISEKSHSMPPVGMRGDIMPTANFSRADIMIRSSIVSYSTRSFSGHKYLVCGTAELVLVQQYVVL